MIAVDAVCLLVLMLPLVPAVVPTGFGLLASVFEDPDSLVLQFLMLRTCLDPPMYLGPLTCSALVPNP